jgi:hypothetical protein
MGYSKNPQTLERRLYLLTALRQGKECSWKCKPEHERAFAYKIREALYIAEKIAAAEYPELAEASQNFSITETGEGRIEARRKNRPDSLPFTTEPVEESVSPAGEGRHGKISFSGDHSLISIITLAKESNAESLHFPSINLPEEDLRRLHKWLTENTPYILFWGGDSLTLRLSTPELEPLAFSLTDLE